MPTPAPIPAALRRASHWGRPPRAAQRKDRRAPGDRHRRRGGAASARPLRPPFRESHRAGSDVAREERWGRAARLRLVATPPSPFRLAPQPQRLRSRAGVALARLERAPVLDWALPEPPL